MHDDADNDEQRTHDETRRVRNVAALFILATRTFGDRIAPENKICYTSGDEDDDTPDCSHWKEFSRFFLFVGDIQEGA